MATKARDYLPGAEADRQLRCYELRTQYADEDDIGAEAECVLT